MSFLRNINDFKIEPIEVEIIPCPGCGRNDYIPIASGPDYDNHCCGNQVFTMVQCRLCETYFLNPRPTVDALPIIYSMNEYYAYRFSEKGNSLVLRAREKRDQRKLKKLMEKINFRPEEIRVLDIGAGDGAFLQAWKGIGVPLNHLYGLDLEAEAVENLKLSGFHGILGRAENIDLPPASFEVISLIQVIEHVAEPKKILCTLNKLLRPGGVLLIETPNMASWDRKIFSKKTWGGYHFPRHWTLWTPDSMTCILNEAQFDVISLSTPVAAVTWTWSINHILQSLGMPMRFCNLFSLSNPLALGFFWILDFLPSVLGRSSNMRLLAYKR